MSKQLLIYEELAAVSKERHRDWYVKGDGGYGFARGVNSVPLTAVEFPQAATDLPIVFAQAGEAVIPVALLGLRTEQNLFVDTQGRWTGQYVPAFLRRYPFVFSATKLDEKEVFTLCIDEKFEGCNQDGRGERLFDADGESTQYLRNVLGFQQEYRTQTLRTQAFCRKLGELELLEPMTARVAPAGGPPVGLTGFRGIQRRRLHELPAESLHELSVTGELELAYLHLHSLSNLKAMATRAAEQARRGAGGNGVAAGATDPGA